MLSRAGEVRFQHMVFLVLFILRLQHRHHRQREGGKPRPRGRHTEGPRRTDPVRPAADMFSWGTKQSYRKDFQGWKVISTSRQAAKVILRKHAMRTTQN